jgi:hypothetical protein
MIQDTERKEWAHHPVTIEFIELLKTSRQDTMVAWAREAFVGQTGEATLQANAKALGGANAIEQVIDMVESYKRVGE